MPLEFAVIRMGSGIRKILKHPRAEGGFKSSDDK